MYRILGRISHLIRSIHNLIKWFPVIWNDRDYDAVYVQLILLHKLKSIKKTFLDPKQIHQVDESRLAVVKYVDIAITLLNRLIEDDFMTEKDHAVYSTIKHEWIPCEDNPKLVQMITLNSPPAEVLDEIRDRSTNLKNKTRRLFFLVLEKRLEHWWD